jgi:hypothetical protein
MSFKKYLELMVFIEDKLSDLEPMKDGSLEHVVKMVEALIEKGYTFK